jgi:hypothetical protein
MKTIITTEHVFFIFFITINQLSQVHIEKAHVEGHL